MRKVLVTGGLGFIGSNFIKHWLKTHPQDQVLNIDAYTYAARPEFLNDDWDHPNLKTIKGDIRNRGTINYAMQSFEPDAVIHLAAESHVCNSIEGPEIFMQTNVLGTFNVIEEFRNHLHQKRKRGRFLHVSTDEVFGELPEAKEVKFHELWPVQPRSPYSASKAASDMVVQAYGATYGMDVVLTNCSNNYGPNQHPEKLIPKTIHKIMSEKPVSVYGQGDHIRDWIFVLDHCRAIDRVFHHGKSGERYCVGGEMELTNMQVIHRVHQAIQDILGGQVILDLIHSNERPTDDFRYAIDNTKIKGLGWSPSMTFEHWLDQTIRWYLKTDFGIRL